MSERARFSSLCHGKWILSGEHTVLRGGESLVFPVESKKLLMSFDSDSGSDELEVEIDSAQPEIFTNFLSKLLERCFELVGEDKKSQLVGRLQIKNDLALGSGMGGSAVLSVSLARLFAHHDWIAEDEVFQFAKQLEMIPHGESSGVDIASVIKGQPLKFHRENGWQEFDINWKPRFYLYHSGEKGVTSECVNHVKSMIEKDPAWGEKIDSEMKTSVQLCSQALQRDLKEGFDLLVKGIDAAYQCFEEWQLVTGNMKKKIEWLRNEGAVAVKPVGSGRGGYILGLWREPPKNEILTELVSCFE